VTTSWRDETKRGGMTRRRDDERSVRQRNNQPVQQEDERAVRGALRGRGEVMQQQAGTTS